MTKALAISELVIYIFLVRRHRAMRGCSFSLCEISGNVMDQFSSLSDSSSNGDFKSLIPRKCWTSCHVALLNQYSNSMLHLWAVPEIGNTRNTNWFDLVFGERAIRYSVYPGSVII